MQWSFRSSARFLPSAAALAAALMLSACSTGPTFQTQKNWKADGDGRYVNVDSGNVITESQYTEVLALELRNRISARMAMTPQYCPPVKK